MLAYLGGLVGATERWRWKILRRCTLTRGRCDLLGIIDGMINKIETIFLNSSCQALRSHRQRLGALPSVNCFHSGTSTSSRVFLCGPYTSRARALINRCFRISFVSHFNIFESPQSLRGESSQTFYLNGDVWLSIARMSRQLVHGTALVERAIMEPSQFLPGWFFKL